MLDKIFLSLMWIQAASDALMVYQIIFFEKVNFENKKELTFSCLMELSYLASYNKVWMVLILGSKAVIIRMIILAHLAFLREFRKSTQTAALPYIFTI